MAGGMFFLGGAINTVPHLLGRAGDLSIGVGAMFLGLGAAWVAIGAMFKKQAEKS